MTQPIVEEERDFLAAVLESIPHGVIAWGSDGRCRLVNGAAAQMTGLSKEELLGRDIRSFSSLLDRSTDPEEARRFREALEAEAAISSAALVLSRATTPLPVRADLTSLPGGGIKLSLAVLPQAPSREDIFERTVLDLYEHTPDPVVVHRKEALIYANPATIRALGYESLEEIRGRPVIELVHPDDRACVAERISRMSTRGDAVPIKEERFLRKDGGVMTALVAALPLPYHGEQAITVIGHDLTELKRVEAEREALLGRISEERSLFREVIAHVPAGIAVLRGPDLVLEHANEAFQALMPEVSLVGRSIREIGDRVPLPPDLLDRLNETDEPVTVKNLEVPLGRRAAPKDEDARFDFSCVRVPAIESSMDRYVLLAVDTTEQARSQKRIEELADAARRNAAELAAVLDNMADTVIVCDVGEQVRVLNKAARRLLGFRDDQDIDLDLHSISERLKVRNDVGEPEELPMTKALRGEIVENAEVIASSPGLERQIWLRVSAGPIRDSDGRILAAVSVAHDVSDQLELDRLKDQFIRVATHELKTPVTIIKGYALTLSESDGRIPKGTRDSLDAIVRGADRIERIVTDLVSISEVELRRLDVDRETVDLSRLVSASADRANMAYEKRRVRVTGEKELVAFVDTERVGQALDHIITNALAYSPGGEEVDVETRRRGSYAEISVRDRGIGIPKDKQAHIFERFYRVHTDTPYDYGGLGVGLYLARQVILAHGGQVSLESEEGVGSTFFIRIPLGSEARSDA